MADDGAMHSLLAAVAAAAASSASPSPNRRRPQPPDPAVSPQPSSPSVDRHSPPPPPPLPPPLPVPPPLPPQQMRRQPPPPPLSSPHPPQPKQQPQPQQFPPKHHPQSLPLTNLPALPAYEKKRKGARIFSAQEKDILEANYAKNKFPSRLHMETLGKALGKGSEKVRTWYNNRRATDRRQGIDVTRNATDDLTPTSSSFPSSPFPSPSPLVEETVLLPSHVLAHLQPTNVQPTPPSASPNPPTTPKPQTSSAPSLPPRTPDSRFPTATSPYVNVTPSSISWAPSIANTPTTHFSPASYPSNRFRISPLRIRHVCISLASHFLFGELPHNLQLDRGLEVKFLFGKKRVVYEWYYGHDHSLAQTTGGPYCKMEMNFASICDMQLFTRPTMSMLILSFSLMPTLFLQTQQSMDKYKLRSQQRQYRRVSSSEFPIPVHQHNHAILLRSDEAIRTVKILLEDTPRLTSVLQVHNHKPFPIQLPPVLQNVQHLSSSASDTPLPVQTMPIALPSCSAQAVTAAKAQPQQSATPPPPPALPPHALQKGAATISSMACSTPAGTSRSRTITPCSTVRRRPLSIHELSSRPDATPTDTGANDEQKRSISQVRHYAKTSVMKTTVSKNEALLKQSRSASVKAPNAHTSTPATSWRSPATPFTRTSTLVFSGGARGSCNAKPLTERINHRDTPTNGTRVRRELNFNGYGGGDTTTSSAYKRKANEMGGKENDERAVVRRRTVHVNGSAKANVRLLAAGIPPPPLPPPLPSSRKEEGAVQNGGQHADEKGATCSSAPKDEGGRLLQKLPR